MYFFLAVCSNLLLRSVKNNFWDPSYMSTAPTSLLPPLAHQFMPPPKFMVFFNYYCYIIYIHAYIRVHLVFFICTCVMDWPLRTSSFLCGNSSLAETDSQLSENTGHLRCYVEFPLSASACQMVLPACQPYSQNMMLRFLMTCSWNTFAQQSRQLHKEEVCRVEEHLCHLYSQ